MEEKTGLNKVTAQARRQRNYKALYNAIELSLIALAIIDVAPAIIPVTVVRTYKLWKLSRVLSPARKVLSVLGRIVRRGI